MGQELSRLSLDAREPTLRPSTERWPEAEEDEADAEDVESDDESSSNPATGSSSTTTTPAAPALPKKSKKKRSERGKKPGRRRKNLEESETRRAELEAKREGAKCTHCGRGVVPATIEGFEAHLRTCRCGEECWRLAAQRNRAFPESLVDETVELRGGLTATVLGVRQLKLRRTLQLPTQHVLQFDSGRQDVVCLDDGTSGQAFRVLPTDEAAELRASNARRLQAELRAAKDAASDLASVRRQLEESTLCGICLDNAKNTAFVPCGHRVCDRCAATVFKLAGDAKCPVCRADARSTLRVYN
mmetsp:Transcript_24027/g.74035  ORF Transcript_24027/g.74035 Transcript_24027/m.74035 type:complete len:301 (+) Transcript_24027:57-959(+)